jgi:transcriptional regulator with XRE-family HTH domain
MDLGTPISTSERELFDTLKDLKVANHERLLRGMMYITGIRQIDIARKYNIDKTVLSKVLSGKRKSPRVRQAIASELQVPVEVLWPKEDLKTPVL